MPASYTIRRSVPRNTRRSNPASTPSTCFPSFSINLFMAFPLPRGDLSSNTTNIIREQETPSPFGCGYAALCPQADHLLYKIIASRNQKRSTALVTNVDFDKWGEYMTDGPLAMALLDRLVERAIILKIKGKTYRTPLVKAEDNPA